MKSFRLIQFAALLALLIGVGLPAFAADEKDPAYDAAVELLRTATQSSTIQEYHPVLMGLRRVKDPDLRPLLNALANSKDKTRQINALLGLAELSKDQRLDLALFAEVADHDTFESILSAAIDSKLIDQAGLKTVLGWNDLSLWSYQMAALRMLSEGGSVQLDRFRKALGKTPEDTAEPIAILHWAFSALILAEAGDAKGKQALLEMADFQNDPGLSIRIRLLLIVKRLGLASGGEMALKTASDKRQTPNDRLLAVIAAFNTGTPGTAKVWQDFFESQESLAKRIAIARAPLLASKDLPPDLFKVLEKDKIEVIRKTGVAARAMAQKQQDLTKPFDELIKVGQTPPARWLLDHAEQIAPNDTDALLELLIRHHASGEGPHKPYMFQIAIDAAHRLCEVNPQAAIKRLPTLLTEGNDNDEAARALRIQRRQIVLMGIARTPGASLKPLAERLKTDLDDDIDDLTCRALRLLIIARHGLPLTDKQWSDVGEWIQGVGGMDLQRRAEFAWLYLKHKGKHKQAIQAAIK